LVGRPTHWLAVPIVPIGGGGNMESAGSLAQAVVWGGFVIGLGVGLIGSKTDFCTLGAVSDLVNMGDWGRMRMWLLSIGVAILGANGLELAGLVDLHKSIYRSPNFIWLSYILGGFLFGVGMTLASGCGTKTLMRIGTGNLKSIVVFIVLGVVAYITMKGALGVIRVNFLEPVAIHFRTSQDLATLLGEATGVRRQILQAGLALLLGGGLVLFALAGRNFRTADHLLGGIGIGAAIVAGWYLTGHVGYGESPDTLEMVHFGTNSHRPESVTNVAPFAYTLELLMLWSDASLTVTFAIAVVVGIVLGSFVHALTLGRFRVEGFRSADDTARHLIGGTLMGFGGVVAMGCTFGQGITGFSTLALGSILTFLCIVAGSAVTMKYQYWRMTREAGT
jgi:uncharacterized membrane protein YedE/YeeE